MKNSFIEILTQVKNNEISVADANEMFLNTFSLVKNVLFSDLDKIFAGIDKDETEDSNGWWETDTGVEFGKRKLAELKDYITARQNEPKTTWRKIAEPPNKTGEYMVYRAENDTQSVLFWNGGKWGYNGETDGLVSHWTDLMDSPTD